MPASQGGRNRPMVPSRHTMMNIHRKMRSITIATYFQSSFTCTETTAKDPMSNLFPNFPSPTLCPQLLTAAIMR